MSNEIRSNSYKYIIDTSYGINKDGFIAIGTESIVYKGLKTKFEGGMQFSCVLKFKPKFLSMDGRIIDRLEQFKTEENKIFEELRECRSVVRIDDVVEELGDFCVLCDKVRTGVINSESYFCIVEEFIDGWSLEEYCREEYWKLRRIEPLANGLSNVLNYHEFTDDEKMAIKQNYTYENILKYQNQILLFMINLCEILQFVTEQKYILHLDIKPENIMVTRYGKELVLIDFGRSKKVTKANRFALSNLAEVNYKENETITQMYQYGSLGYAAPECYANASNDSEFPFSENIDQGKMSIESDIFSFGATFWECLNIFELVTKNKEFSVDSYSFYKDHFLNEAVYCDRDLSCTSLFYQKKLENILIKCTRKRVDTYVDVNNRNYYHSYAELKKEIESTKDSVPTILKEENIKAKNAFRLSGVMLSLVCVFLIIYYIYQFMAFSIAERKWDSLTANYNETQFFELEETANELVTTATGSRVNDIYNNIASFTYKEDDISEYEAEMLVILLQKIGDNGQLPQRVDDIMKHANTRKFKAISTEIIKLDEVNDSVGYKLARAIFDVEVSKKELVEAYKTWVEYQNNSDFHNAVQKLKNVLDNDENIKLIADSMGVTRQEIKEAFKVFEVKETTE